MINKRKIEPILFLKDDISFKVFRSRFKFLWLIRNISFHIKKAFNLLKNPKSFYARKSRKLDELKFFQGDKKYVNLIIKESYEDYRIHSSTQSLIFKDINKNNLALVIKLSNPKNIKTVSFRLFLKNQINHLNQIYISGFFQGSESYQEEFKIKIDRSIIAGFERPAYWLNISLTPENLKKFQAEKSIKVFLDKITFDKQAPLYNITSADNFFHQNTTNKQIYILSFDGITASDICSKGVSENFPNISKFIEENTEYKNAITSSTVTASSAASLMTGYGLPYHRIFSYNDFYLSKKLMTLSPQIKTLGEKAFEKQIKATGLFAFGKWAPQYGYSRGFYDYKSINSGALHNYRWLENCISTITENKDNQFMYMIHHPGGHPPYTPYVNNSFKNLEYSAYQKNLKNVDSFFGCIINTLKANQVYDNAMIIFLADHGSSLASLYSRKKFQFTEDRLRVPLIIKKSVLDQNLLLKKVNNKYLSAQSFVNELVSNYIGINSKENDLERRTFKNISWLCETMDYKKNNVLGLVGYSDGIKYTLFYDVKNWSVNDLVSCSKYKIVDSNELSKEIKVTDQNELKKVIESSKQYLSEGFEFSNLHPPVALGEHINFI